MNNKMVVVIVGALFLIAGCSSKVIVSSPTDEMLQTAEYGSQPTNIKQDLQDYFDRTLKDPQSVQIKPITEPEKGYMYTVAKETPWKGEERYVNVEYQPVFGWLSCALYNAKNSYGAYIGFQKLVIFYENGRKQPYIQKAKYVGIFPSGLVMSSRYQPVVEGEPEEDSIRSRAKPVIAPQKCAR